MADGNNTDSPREGAPDGGTLARLLAAFRDQLLVEAAAGSIDKNRAVDLLDLARTDIALARDASPQAAQRDSTRAVSDPRKDAGDSRLMWAAGISEAIGRVTGDPADAERAKNIRGVIAEKKRRNIQIDDSVMSAAGISKKDGTGFTMADLDHIPGGFHALASIVESRAQAAKAQDMVATKILVDMLLGSTDHAAGAGSARTIPVSPEFLSLSPIYDAEHGQ